MTQPGHSTNSLAQAWDDLIKWLSHAPPSQQAAVMQNPQGALAQFGLGGVSPTQLQDVITHSPSFDRSYAVNQGSGGNHHNAIDPTPHPGESPAAAVGRVFNYHMENNYSQVVDNSVNVAGNVSGGIHQHNVVGDHNTTGPSFDIDGDMTGQIVTGDHSNAAGHDLDASVMGAGATHVGSGNSFGEGTNFGSGTNAYTDNRGAHIDNSDHSDNSDHIDNSEHSDNSEHNDFSNHSVDSLHNDFSDHSVDSLHNDFSNHSQNTHVGGDLDAHGTNNF